MPEINRPPLLSIVAPVFCEEEGVGEFYRRTRAMAQSLNPPMDYEIVLVDDGSRDRTPEILAELASQDPHLVVLPLARNFGHQIAITAGIDHARGDVVVVIDSDLQDPPEVIPAMLEQWRKGYDVVYGVRAARAGDSAVKRALAAAFYRILQRLSDTPMPLDVGDFRLMDRQVVDAFKQMREQHRYVRGMIAWVGFRQTGLKYKRDERYAGKPKYTTIKSLKLAINGIASFSDRPLVMAGYAGAFIAACAVLLGLKIVIDKLMDPSGAVPGWASLAVVVMFLGGAQLMSIGLMGLYVGKLFTEAKARPLYLVARRGLRPAADAVPPRRSPDGGGSDHGEP